MIINGQNKGFTLIEMVLVIVIIGIISTIAMKSLQSSTEQTRFDTTVGEMDRLARAIVGDERLVSGGFRTDFGYVGDVGSLPANLDALVSNTGGYATWKGPYISSDFTQNIDDYKRDAWNQPYNYAGGVMISSTGGGSPITKQFAKSTAALLTNTIKGIIRDSGLAPPGDSASGVTITIHYPDGAGSLASSSVTPSRSGEFSFTSSIPIGIHPVEAVFGVDTVAKFIAIYPDKVTYTELRFPTNVW
jgi:prepilin-type N-terminal cleavage/methylation domain-containing protein